MTEWASNQFKMILLCIISKWGKGFECRRSLSVAWGLAFRPSKNYQTGKPYRNFHFLLHTHTLEDKWKIWLRSLSILVTQHMAFISILKYPFCTPLCTPVSCGYWRLGILPSPAALLLDVSRSCVFLESSYFWPPHCCQSSWSCFQWLSAPTWMLSSHLQSLSWSYLLCLSSTWTVTKFL